jgi:hypothetical protein
LRREKVYPDIYYKLDAAGEKWLKFLILKPIAFIG